MKALSLTRLNSVLFCAVLVGGILYVAKPVLVPITFAIFFAMLFSPLCDKMEKKGMKRVWSSLLSVFITMLLAASLIFVVYGQGKKLAEQGPQMKKKIEQIGGKLKGFIGGKLNMSEQQLDKKVQEQASKASESPAKLIGKSLVNLTDFLVSAVMVIIFMFLFLFHRERYEIFFIKLVRSKNVDEAQHLIRSISKVSYFYLRGRMMSVAIFTVLFTTGFMIVGIKNGFLLGLVAALLTIIPYIGSIIGGLIPFAVTLVSEESNRPALGALSVVLIVQAVDNYFMEPYIIGGQVKLSAFATLLIIFVGGLVWGIAGVILFIPMLGVIKAVFDHFPELEPYSYLISDPEEKKPDPAWMKKLKEKFKNKHPKIPATA